jgi:hypothetical protein
MVCSCVGRSSSGVVGLCAGVCVCVVRARAPVRVGELGAVVTVPAVPLPPTQPPPPPLSPPPPRPPSPPPCLAFVVGGVMVCCVYECVGGGDAGAPEAACVQDGCMCVYRCSRSEVCLTLSFSVCMRVCFCPSESEFLSTCEFGRGPASLSLSLSVWFSLCLSAMLVPEIDHAS